MQTLAMDPKLEEILRLAQRGAKLEALRVLRSLTGMSLEEADTTLKKLQTPGAPREWIERLTDVLRQRVQPGEAPRAERPVDSARAPAAQAPPQRGSQGGMSHHIDRQPARSEERRETQHSDAPRKHASKPRHSTLSLGTPLAWVLVVMMATGFFAVVLVGLLYSRFA